MVKTHQVYLSIVIPVYNEEARIAKSLESVFNFLQSQPYIYEVIVVDDGSLDRTVELVRERFGKDSRVRIP